MHRIERLRALRYHHKLILSIVIVLCVLGVLLALGKDWTTLRIESAYGAGDPRFPTYLAALVGSTVTTGNSYTVLTNGDVFLPAMLDAIDRAQRSVWFETYNYEKGVLSRRFTSALASAARRGARVTLIVDAVGSKKMPHDEWQELHDAGVRLADYGTLRWYKPQAMNYRSHRKLLIVDGTVAFTGGEGVADKWMGQAQDPDHWRDTMVEIQGPLVRLLEGAFDDTLVDARGPVTPQVDSPRVPPEAAADRALIVRGSASSDNDLKRLYMIAIASARQTLDICSPYFITDASSNWALAQARARGVKVRILVDGDHTDALPVKFASRAAYSRFLKEGIDIYEYQPTMLHTKVMVIDGTFSMFGSANFDNRSLELNDELNVAVVDRALAARLLEDFNKDLQSAKRIDAGTWSDRSPLERGREQFWRWFDEAF
ncbi:MAG: phospholipase D-like domain-containing protein [Vicinamibacterales bacterium]